MKRLCKIFVTWMMFSITLTNTMADELDITDIHPSGYSKNQDTLYIVDDYSNKIYQYDQDTLTFIAGNENLVSNIPQGGLVNGKTEYSLFNDPFMAVYWNGGIVVSDTKNHILRYIKDGITSTYAGANTSGYVDGNIETSLFYLPSGLAIDDDGNLLVADTGNGVIRKVSKEGIVSTYIDDLKAPVGICYSEGVLYITDVVTNEILKYQDHQLSVVAGIAMNIDDEWIAGFDDGSLSDATFNCPQGIYVENEVIYVADTGNGAIRRIYEDAVETIYQSDLLIMPTGIIIYHDQMLIGDSFARNHVTLQSHDVIPEEVQEEIIQENLDINEEMSQQVQGEKSNFNTILIVGICGASVVVGILLWKMNKKKKIK